MTWAFLMLTVKCLGAKSRLRGNLDDFYKTNGRGMVLKGEGIWGERGLKGEEGMRWG